MQARPLFSSMTKLKACCICAAADAWWFCLDCAKFMCHSCHKKHNMVQRSWSHKYTTNTKDHNLCKTHKELISMYCVDCEVAICVYCPETNHPYHRTDLLEDFGHDRRNIMHKELDKINAQSEENKTKVNHDYDETIKKLGVLGSATDKQIGILELCLDVFRKCQGGMASSDNNDHTGKYNWMIIYYIIY